MNTFDTVYIILLAFFFFRGWTKGLFQSIIGPACLAVWSIIGIMNYDLNENIIKAIMVTIIGSFCSTLIIHIALFLGHRSVEKQDRDYVFIGSRILGGALNTGWNGLLAAFLAIILVLMPANFLGLKTLQTKIESSISYSKFYRYLITPFPSIKNVIITVSIFKNYGVLHKYQDTPEYKRVFSHPKIQQLIQIPELMEKLYSKDSFSLINDPYIRSILQDEKLIEDISSLGKKIYHGRAMQQ